MVNTIMKIGEISKPRFEFRTFGQNFDKQAKLMARLSIPVPRDVWERSSDETYILSKTNNDNNTKIRDGKMDIKTLVKIVDGLEQWNPLMKGEFPISKEVLKNEVFPAFQLKIPAFKKDSFTFDEFMVIIDEHPDLQNVKIHKQRFGYMVNNTICEIGNILINGAKIVTINSESTELNDIKKTIKDISLEGFENINYLQAIKRVIGWINKPLAN